jgi:hypothetical protein
MRSVGFVVALMLSVAACSGGSASERRPSAGTGGDNGSGGSSLIGPSGLGGTSTLGNLDAGQLPPLHGTVKSDSGDMITVSGMPATVKFHVELDDGSQPHIVWSVDDTRIGSVGDDGVFHANGYVGGKVTVTAKTPTGMASTTITVNVDITENPAAASDADKGLLTAGGAADASFKWLYPYDKTVFPRGLAAPTLQFAGTAPTTTYLKITAPSFSYQQFAAGATPFRVTIPDAIWKGVTLTAGAADKVIVSVTKLSGGQAAGPIGESWAVAQASLKGIVYYNTYKSPLANNGGVMRIRAGGTAEVVQAGCTVCHSVSANGNVLAVGMGNMPDERGDWNPVDSATYNLSAAGTATQRTQSSEGRLFSFAALTPDGKLGLVQGLPPGRSSPYTARGIVSTAGFPSKLVDTATGQDVAAPSLAALVKYATAPTFSPDAKHVAFANDDRLEAKCFAPACDDACTATCTRVMTVLDFDGTATPPAFSNPRDLLTQSGPGKAIAWPTFLPDSKAILYHEGDSFDSYVFNVAGADKPQGEQHAELRLVEVADKTVKTLNAVNGRNDAGVTYLPFGEMAEGRENYEPSVLPVAVGGYYWVLFTSRRVYGNTISPTSTNPSGPSAWGTEANPSVRKKLWMAAIDIDHATKADPSHPALFLPGQEIEAGNMRAFAALAPCKADNESCESGSDCCNGFCRETSRSTDGVPVLACVPPPPNTCSNVDEKCQSVADCCDQTDLCINNRCTSPPVK